MIGFIGYIARVEFALKLGYTEHLVQAALEKLGPDPDQNELLAELIKLGANYSQKLTQPPEETDGSSKTDLTSNLRPIVIDGSNVAMSHGNNEVFSCKGIKICVDWFKARGHKEITVFVPKWRKETSRIDNPITDQDILGELERDRLLVFTPSRLVGGKRMVCYDDRYILRLAVEIDGIVVSNDNYRDLAQECPEFRKVIEDRILMYSFANDRFMPPDDPLGRSGPTLEKFLKVVPKKIDPAPPCPYAKKCTYGNKCKFEHPERGTHPQKTVTERLVEHAQRHLQARGPSLSLPLPVSTSTGVYQHQALCKSKSVATGIIHQPLSAGAKCGLVENVTSNQSTSSFVPNELQPAKSFQGCRSFGQRPDGFSNREGEVVPNTHRKLQRQLTLNPACDPRLSQLKRNQQTSQLRTSQTTSSAITPSTAQQHKPLTRHASNELSHAIVETLDHPDGNSRHHQHVTRIASAPGSYPAWPSSSSNAVVCPGSSERMGASDSELNLIVSSLFSNMAPSMLTQFLDIRTRIHYHLANIFPEEHVRTAMAMHPFETDPKQICAAVLKLYRQ